MMENYEELLNKLEEFERTKPKELPKELEDFIGLVAKTGDPIYPWPKIRLVYRSKIMSVLNQFYEAGPPADSSQFSYESMKAKIIERFDSFRSAPFTIQRLSELLLNPRKEYARIDKLMRAIEKNILVVSGVDPGWSKRSHLNGTTEILEEGFQVTSTSVNEENRQKVSGILESEITGSFVSEDDQCGMRKTDGISEKRKDITMEEDTEQIRKRSKSNDSTEDEAADKAALPGSGPILEHQEFHSLEYSLAETETLAIVEIVSDVSCTSESSGVGQEESKDLPLSNSVIVEDSSGSCEALVGSVTPQFDTCDPVTEVIATEAVTVVEELVIKEENPKSEEEEKVDLELPLEKENSLEGETQVVNEDADPEAKEETEEAVEMEESESERNEEEPRSENEAEPSATEVPSMDTEVAAEISTAEAVEDDVSMVSETVTEETPVSEASQEMEDNDLSSSDEVLTADKENEIPVEDVKDGDDLTVSSETEPLADPDTGTGTEPSPKQPLTTSEEEELPVSEDGDKSASVKDETPPTDAS